MCLGWQSGLLSKQSCSMYIYVTIVFVYFSVENLTLWVPFFQPIVHLAANNRFSRRFVWGQKGVACGCLQNEYLFDNTAICTYFGAICYKIECVLRQNGVRFDAKWTTFWCKTQGKMPLNAACFAAKRKLRCSKMRDKKHKHTQQLHKQHLCKP